MATLTLAPASRNEPLYRPRPAESSPGLVTYETHDGTPVVFVRLGVLERVIAHSHDKSPNETIGFLMGRSFRDEQGVWTLVEAVWCCEHASCSRVSVQTSEIDEQQLDAWRQSDALAYDKMGWWHSHYELRVPQYSGVDRDNQQMWCPLACQVGLLVLVDRGVPRVRCYRGPDSEPLAPLRHEDGSAEPLAERRSDRIGEESAGDPAADTDEPTPTPAVDWRRVAAGVAATLIYTALLGFATGVIPPWGQLWPPTKVEKPVPVIKESDHAEPQRRADQRRDPRGRSQKPVGND